MKAKLIDMMPGDMVTIRVVVAKQRPAGRTDVLIPGVGRSGHWDLPNTANVEDHLGNVHALAALVQEEG